MDTKFAAASKLLRTAERGVRSPASMMSLASALPGSVSKDLMILLMAAPFLSWSRRTRTNRVSPNIDKADISSANLAGSDVRSSAVSIVAEKASSGLGQ